LLDCSQADPTAIGRERCANINKRGKVVSRAGDIPRTAFGPMAFPYAMARFSDVATCGRCDGEETAFPAR